MDRKHVLPEAKIGLLYLIQMNVSLQMFYLITITGTFFEVFHLIGFL
jgi:hypothetical protein